jgi:hypothetical protein
MRAFCPVSVLAPQPFHLPGALVVQPASPQAREDSPGGLACRRSQSAPFSEVIHQLILGDARLRIDVCMSMQRCSKGAGTSTEARAGLPAELVERLELESRGARCWRRGRRAMLAGPPAARGVTNTRSLTAGPAIPKSRRAAPGARPRWLPPDRGAATQQGRFALGQGRGEPHAGLGSSSDLADHHGQRRPSSHQPDYTLLGPSPHRCRDRPPSVAAHPNRVTHKA